MRALRPGQTGQLQRGERLPLSLGQAVSKDRLAIAPQPLREGRGVQLRIVGLLGGTIGAWHRLGAEGAAGASAVELNLGTK
jgi:hypothetical protein